MSSQRRARNGAEWGYDPDGEQWTREWAGDRVKEYRGEKYRIGRQIKDHIVWSGWMSTDAPSAG